ncbi:hypothetical protein, partial [Bacteroides ovatus]|uniref:hypothetical protein n=1 Tax=Bacteroides ovatus TaxID=28116 RepID=UPI0032EDD263
LTLFKYLLVLIVSLLHKTSIDGSIFFTCTTCIVYQYFKELVAFVLKAGAKIRALFLTTKLFRKFFFSFSFYAGFSGSLCERERRYERITLANFLYESDCKDKNFSYYNPNFFGSFLFFSLSGIPLFH